MRAAGVARTEAAIELPGAASAGRVRALGADEVLDYHEPGWPERVRALTGGGADAAVNAARDGAADARADIVVAPDGARLGRLVTLLARGTITITTQPGYRWRRRPRRWTGPGRGRTARRWCSSRPARNPAPRDGGADREAGT
jgi:NADPH:quinone reductase-like Zn-dependent oxidoreductase